jgi:hypothetical protein
MKKRRIFCFFLLISLTTCCFVYCLLSTTYHMRLPIHFTASETPYTEIEIEGKSYPVLFDLGFDCALKLQRSVIDEIQKKAIGPASFLDLHGKKYNTIKYQLSKVKLSSLEFKNVEAREENIDFRTKGSVLYWNDKEEPPREFVGTLGRELLKQVNILLDFSHALVFFSNRLKEIKKSGYDIDAWIKVPFKLDSQGVILNIGTDLGVKRFALDTGASITIFRSSDVENQTALTMRFGMKILPTSKFVIGGKDFGKINLYLRDITPKLDNLDGVLGMDFLSKHQIYLDFRKKVAYIN